MVYPRLLQERSDGKTKVVHVHDGLTLTLEKTIVAHERVLLRTFVNDTPQERYVSFLFITFVRSVNIGFCWKRKTDSYSVYVTCLAMFGLSFRRRRLLAEMYRLKKTVVEGCSKVGSDLLRSYCVYSTAYHDVVGILPIPL